MSNLAVVFFLLSALLGAFASGPRVQTAHRCAVAGNCKNHDFSLQRPILGSELESDHKIVFAVKQDAASCDSLVAEISDPRSDKWGNFLELDELNEMFRNEAGYQAVTEWLDENGISYESTADGGFVNAVAPLSVWTRLLHARFSVWSSDLTGVSIFRAHSAMIPAELTDHLDFVRDVTSFPQVRRASMMLEERAPTASDVTPQLLWAQYNMTTHTVKNTDPKTGSTMSVFESLGQNYNPKDLATFETNNKLPSQKVYQVKGNNDPSDCDTNPNSCAEANLDVQWIIAVANAGPLTYWSIPTGSDIFVEFVQKIAADSNPPLVYSISYGGDESEEDETYVKRFNTEVCKMAARGISIMTASGDDGVCGAGCRGDQSMCTQSNFNPQYPASCPYVTAVGATMGPEAGRLEKVCQSDKGGLITSGGGFSGVFSRPKWQDTDVANYLTNGPNMPPLKQFDSTGRAYPDVAMMGHNYQIVIGGKSYVGSGTSASSPVFAASMVLVNDQRISAGKKPLGFLNKALYDAAQTKGNFHDITTGENNCAAAQTSPVCCQYGFTATTGWDGATGLGSIHLDTLAQTLVALP